MGQNQSSATTKPNQTITVQEIPISAKQPEQTKPMNQPEPEQIEHTEQTTQKFPWEALPKDIKINILRRISIPELITETQKAFVNDAPSEIDFRIRRLEPFHKLWIDSPIAVRNTMPYRSKAARKACTPIEFCKLERLILGSSRLSGCLSPAIAEFAPTLKVLHLNDNNLDSLPDEIALCEKLLLLDCSNNNFTTFPKITVKISSLKHLVFSNNKQLNSIPPQINSLINLNTISLYKCALTELPAELVALVIAADRFSINVASNNFPKGYLADLCQARPSLRSRLAHVVFV